MIQAPSRERRWLVLVGDGTGRHAWLGRHTDPSEAELGQIEERLREQGFPGGWVAVSEGVYYSDDPMSLIRVRDLGLPGTTWDDAVAKFMARRVEARGS
jgi:hypothetical protein